MQKLGDSSGGGGPKLEDMLKAAFEGSKILEQLVLALRKSTEAKTPEERAKFSQEYLDLLHAVVHMDEVMVITILNAGITAISQLFEEDK